MRGSVVKRGASYSVVVELDRDTATGKRKQKWHSGYRTKRDAERALAEMIDAVNRGTYVLKTRQTVAEFAAEWLAAVEPTVRPATHYSYARNLRLHVLPYLGSAPLAAVDAGSLNGVYATLLVSGRKAPRLTDRDDAPTGLSPRSVAYVHVIVHKMCRDAVKWGRLSRNPADAADPPRAARRHAQMTTWTAAQLRAFLDGAREDRLHPAWLMLATTGARRGEMLGLRWSDVDLDAATASVAQTLIVVVHEVRFGSPKTAKGSRVIELDPATVAALREHRRVQAAERLLVGSGWRDHGLVFCRVDGSPLHPDRFSARFVDKAQLLGLPPIRLHDLRHTWASLALADGVHPKIVQERLGHANISITLDIYSHVTAGLHSDAANRVAGLIFGSGD
jgi:integrase